MNDSRLCAPAEHAMISEAKNELAARRTAVASLEASAVEAEDLAGILVAAAAHVRLESEQRRIDRWLGHALLAHALQHVAFYAAPNRVGDLRVSA